MPNASAPTASTDPFALAAWIWGGPSLAQGEDQYRRFRRAFELQEGAGEATLFIAVDTDFVAWVNGVEVARGQFSDWPAHTSWGRFCVPVELLRAGTGAQGRNVLAVQVFHCAADSSTHVATAPGLIAVLEIGTERIVTCVDGNWQTAADSACLSGRSERMTPQTGYTFIYDARAEEPWTLPDFSIGHSSSGWTAVRECPERGDAPQLPRPLPALEQGLMPRVSICAQGLYIDSRPAAADWHADSPADRMASRALLPQFPWRIFANRELKPMFACMDPQADLADVAPADAEYTGAPVDPGTLLGNPLELPDAAVAAAAGVAAGRYFIVDLGRETVGLLELEVDAPAGTVIDIAHGEHLDDGRVRMKIGTRRFADRYICGQGQRTFQMPFRRLGARYLEVHVSGFAQVRWYRIGLRPMQYPTPADTMGRFETQDPLARHAWDVAVHTLGLCRHEHFEDCPWREQALYAYDGRLQALYGYHAFGDYRFAEVSFELLAQGFDPASGLLPLMAPGKCPVNIPVFTLSWIGAIAEHWLYSGEPVLYRRHGSLVRAILEKAYERVDPVTGLPLPPQGEGIWNFYEWTPGLCATMLPGSVSDCTQLDAGYLLFLHEALRQAAWMAHRSGEAALAAQWSANAEALGTAFAQAFWNPESGAWASTLIREADGTVRREGNHELIQVLAAVEFGPAAMPVDVASVRVIRGGTAPVEAAPVASASAPAWKAMPQPEQLPCMLSSLQVVVRAMLAGSAQQRQEVCERLERIWQGMFAAGATAFWETADGARDFDFAGSLCHGWNALPVWFYHTVVLGVRPLEPGFRTFALKIYPHRFTTTQGRIPTPAGFIEVSWSLQGGGLHVTLTHPAACTPQVEGYAEAPVVRLVCNGVCVELPPQRINSASAG